MAKVILICGKICSGKSWYAERLRRERNAVVLSHDELMLAVFDPLLGDRHDEIAAKVSGYLYALAVKLAQADMQVILDWGFWTGKGREEAGRFFLDRGIPFEWHYVHVSDKQWKKNIEKRNGDVLEGRTQAYYVDEGLMRKMQSRFEEPDRREMDVWYENMPEDACGQAEPDGEADCKMC